MITPRPIETAPRDGTPIFAYDGKLWRNQVRWLDKPLGGGPEGWYFQRHLQVRPTHWYPRDADYEELLAEVGKGYEPLASAKFQAAAKELL